MMFTFYKSRVYTTRNAQMNFLKEVWNHLKFIILLKVVHYEKKYDFVDDGSSFHHNQFCKE